MQDVEYTDDHVPHQYDIKIMQAALKMQVRQQLRLVGLRRWNLDVYRRDSTVLNLYAVGRTGRRIQRRKCPRGIDDIVDMDDEQ